LNQGLANMPVLFAAQQVLAVWILPFLFVIPNYYFRSLLVSWIESNDFAPLQRTRGRCNCV
jgi:hypothetical protein